MSEDGPKLLSGGNPQIPKGFGDEPVSAYLAAVPGWKADVCRRIDALVAEKVPGVMKAMKWNLPLHGTSADHYFLSFHCFDRYVKVTFHQGAQLEPMPPGSSKHPPVRYPDVHEGEELFEQFVDWVKQSAALPGDKL